MCVIAVFTWEINARANEDFFRILLFFCWIFCRFVNIILCCLVRYTFNFFVVVFVDVVVFYLLSLIRVYNVASYNSLYMLCIWTYLFLLLSLIQCCVSLARVCSSIYYVLLGRMVCVRCRSVVCMLTLSRFQSLCFSHTLFFLVESASHYLIFSFLYFIH